MDKSNPDWEAFDALLDEMKRIMSESEAASKAIHQRILRGSREEMAGIQAEMEAEYQRANTAMTDAIRRLESWFDKSEV